MNKVRSTILVGIALTLSAMLLLPTVVAQGGVPASSISNPKVNAPTTPIQPAIQNPSFTVTFDYVIPTAAQSANAAATPNVEVKMVPQCTNGVVITGAPSVILQITAGATKIPGTGNFQISIPRTAPGLTPLSCTMKISSPSPGATIGPAPEVPVGFTVTADYYSVNQVKLSSKLKQSGPQKQVPFEMEITNFGNARTQYTFELSADPGGKWQAILPEVLLVESPNSGQGSPVATTTFTVATPFKNGWNNVQGSYQLTVKPTAADDPAKAGNPMTANMLVRVRGVYVPSLEPFVLLGAVLGTALLLRMRRDDEQ